MKKLISILFSLLLTTAVLAGSEEVNMIIDFSACQNDDMNLQIKCEHYDYATNKVIQCHFEPMRNTKMISALLKGDTYIDVKAKCNDKKKFCEYHFKPSKMRNVKYSDEIVTTFPNPKPITVPLLHDQLPILKVECH